MDKSFQQVFFNETDLMGIKIELTKSQKENYFLIRDLWKKFNTGLKNINIRKSDSWVKYGITFRENGQLYYMASVEMASSISVLQIMKTLKIKQGNYLRFIHVGNMYEVKSTINDIYKNIVPSLDFEIEVNKENGLIHFERYDYRFKWDNPGSLFEIYLPVNT